MWMLVICTMLMLASDASAKTGTCPMCKGTGGKAVCTGCGGGGWVVIGYMSAPCPLCYGTGYSYCWGCHGKGVINYPDTPVVPVNPQRGYNGGSGSSSSGRTCSGCGGTGRCTGCNGEGYYWADTGYYVGRNEKSKIRCSSCGGSGSCRVCYGNGVIR